MSRVFVISDTHFGHRNILKFTTRGARFTTIEEHDEALVEYWNSTVTKNDTVYHLGDVAWYAKDADRYLPRLNGRKILISGNHDVPKVINPHFDSVGGARDMRGCILTHIPIHPQEFYRWEFNIHGHLHDGSVKGNDGHPDPRYVCVSCEQVNMRPVELDAVIERARAAT